MSSATTTQTKFSTTEKQARQLALLQEITRLVASDDAIETILKTALQQLLEALQYRAVQIYQLATAGRDVWLYLERGNGPKPVTQTGDIFSVEESNIISDTVRRGAFIYISDVSTGPYSYYTQDDSDPVTGSEVTLPLTHRQTQLGVLRVQCGLSHAFDQGDIDYLTTLANLLASTMSNNRKIDHLQDSIEEIRMLYNLQYREHVEQQQGYREQRRGFKYDQSTIVETNDLPRVWDAAADQSGVVTRRTNGHKALIAPIQLYGETIGVLGLEDDVDEAIEWTDDDISLLEEVSSQVGLAIENARLLQRTQEQTHELSILFEAARQLTETINIQQIYKILTGQTSNYLNADRCTVLLINESRSHFEATVTQVRNADNAMVFISRPRADSIDDHPALRQMLKQSELIVQHLDDPELDDATRAFMTSQADQAIQTLAKFPLVVRNKLVGILEVAHQQRRRFSKNELQLAHAIISQVTVAIENAQLFEQTQSALADTQTLYEISRTLVESTDLAGVFDIILDNVKSFDIDRVSISLIDRAQDGDIETVTIVASWDRELERRLPIGTKFSGKNFPLVKAFAEPPFQPLISHDLRLETGQDERMDPAFQQYAVEKLGATTLFSAPMFMGAEYKGVLSIYTRKPHVYSSREVRIYQTLADQAIIAIENYRLLDTTRLERDRAATLYELGQRLSHTTVVEQIQDAVLEFLPRVGVTNGEIYITDGSEFVSIATTVEERKNIPVAELANFIVANGHEGLALSRQEIVAMSLNNTPAAEWPLKDRAGLDAVRSFVCVPFYSQRSTLQGVLSFFHDDPNGFSRDQISTFESVAIQAAASLENVWLLRQTNIVLRETELLYNVTRGFNSTQTITDLLAVLTENLAGSGIDFMAVALDPNLNNTGKPNRLTLAAAWNSDTKAITKTGQILLQRDFEFIRQLGVDKPSEFHYRDFDSTTQTNIDQKLAGVRAMLSVPLFVGRNWLGVLLLGSKDQDYGFEMSTISQVSTLAGQAAVVLQNLQLVEETEKNLKNSELLSNLGQQLLNADTTEIIYQLALSAVAATVPDRGASIFIYDQVDDEIEMELAAVWDYPEKEWPTALDVGSRLPTEELDLVPMLKTGLTVVSNDATNDERFSPMLQQLLTTMQIKVLVAVPLWIKKEVGGFMLIGNETDTLFPADNIRLYEDIARQTSGALENRRLFSEAQHRAWQLETASDVSQAATSYLDLDTLLFQAVDLIKERFNFYHASIFLVDEYQRYAVVRASTGEIGQKMLANNHKLEVGGRSIVGTATGTGKPRIALDVGKDAIHFNNPLLPKTRSEMALPFIAQGKIIGALDVQSTKRGAFTQSDITILQSMANQLANAIVAARAYQESKEAVDEITKLHQQYLMNQWDVFLKEQSDSIGLQLIENGQVVEVSQADPTLFDSTQLVQEKRPVLSSGNGSQPAPGNNDAEPETDIDIEAQGQALEPAESASRLLAPLTLYGRSIIGMLDFDIPPAIADEPLDDDVLQIIEAVSGQAAQAVEAARLFEQSQIAREEAEALYEVGRALVTAETEQEMYNTVLAKMLSTIGLKQGGVLFFNKDRRLGRLYALYRDGKPVDNPDTEFPIAGNLSYEKLIETKRPVAIEDMTTDPLVASIRAMGLAPEVLSLLLVPIIIQDQVVGALGADAVKQTHHFTEREMNLAMAMADQLSIALQNRRLIEETRRRALLLQTSSEVGRVATSILDQEDLMDKTVELIRDRFGFYHVQIFLIDEADEYAVLHKSTGEAGEKLLAMHHKFTVGDGSVIGQVTARRQAIVINDTDMPDAEIPSYRIEFLPDTRSELGIPLQVGDALIGALDVQSKQPNAFTDEDVSTLETLATQLAVAIQNARAFKEQQETAQRLKEIDKLKTQFLANMSHELRTPLNSIIGFSRVILKGIDGPLTDLQKTDLTSIYNSGQHLLGLINNILDLSKIEAGKMELNFEETEVEPIIKTVMSTALALVKDKPVTLHQEIPENLPFIWADATRVRQIILNLVSNACKFTDEGTVTAKVVADEHKVTFSVIDTGIGIPQEKLDQIFEEFTQVDASTTRKVGGTGLGLPISRHFVEMHKGSIWVDSQPGAGTTVSFSIPTSSPSKKHKESYQPEERDDSDGSKRVIVAIDDDTTVVNLYKRFLSQQDYEVIGVKSGRDAVEQVKEHAPFAILLDIIIPEKDGWSVLADLKQDAFTRNIPVVICSIVNDRKRGLSLGAAGYLNKPIVEEELMDIIKHFDTQQKESVKVLVVDDHADDVLLIRRILEAQPNYTISQANDGQQGLEMVKGESPDLIILDLNMPEMDGFAMMEALRENEKTRDIPIIIVSAQEITSEEQEQIADQVEVSLRKGIFTEQELLEDVSRALKNLRSAVNI